MVCISNCYCLYRTWLKFGSSKNCGINYRRIEEIKDMIVLEEGQSTQNSQASPASTSTPPSASSPNRQNEKLPTSFPRSRPPPKPQDEEDDIGSYSRVQIIDTSFRIQKVRKGKALPGMLLTPQDLKDLERLAAYLATIYGLHEEDCLVVLQEMPDILAEQAEQLASFKDYYSQDEIHPGDKVATLWAYQPRAADEFLLERGDMLKVVGVWDDGWGTGVMLNERADDWDAKRNTQRDSGVSSGFGRRESSPPVSGEIKAFPLVCVCLPEYWRKTIEGDG